VGCYDDETRLPGRALLLDRLSVALARCERTGHALTLLLIDAGADAAGAAAIVTGAVRVGDTVARVAERELAVIADDLVDPGEALAVGRRLLALLADRDPAIGLTVAAAPRRDAAAVLREAATALSRARRAGGGCEAFDSDVGDRARVEADVAGAIARGELLLRYQPIVDLADGSVHGVEALVRGTGPRDGAPIPGELLAAAEESGAIVSLGAWALRDACRQVAHWHAARAGRPGFVPFWLAVGVRARQLAHPAFADAVLEALRAGGLPAALLGLELTEPELATLPEEGVAALGRLRAGGVRLVVDEATAAWAERAHGLRVDVLKPSPAQLDAVLASHPADVEVVAGRIEEREQEVAVRRAGGRLAQGPLYARPASAAEVEALLDLLDDPAPLASRRPPATPGDAPAGSPSPRGAA
jgi:EAL domain-containing protein (putative c-di-GMP-specific phosphodiesterase class I)/GGDEF domain-containing protein